MSFKKQINNLTITKVNNILGNKKNIPCNNNKNIAIMKEKTLMARKGKSSMQDVKTLADNELYSECTKVYTIEEMKASLELSKTKMKENNYRVFDNNLIDELRSKHYV